MSLASSLALAFSYSEAKASVPVCVCVWGGGGGGGDMEAEKGQGQCTHSYPNTEWVRDATTTADRCMDTYRDLHGQIKGNAHTFT